MVIYINGPINIITISKNNKKMTLVCDYHEDVEEETNCDKIIKDNGSVVELKDFIINKLNASSISDKEFHIFIETMPYIHNIRRSDEEPRYADKLINIFLEGYTEENIYEGITLRSTKFPNTILHFVDIRNLVFPNMDKLFRDMAKMIYKFNATSDMTHESFQNIRKTIDKVNDLIKFTYDSLYTLDDKTIKDLNEEFLLEQEADDKSIIAMKLTINKLSSSYNDPKTKETINKYINGELKDKFNEFFSLYDKIIISLDKYELDSRSSNDNHQFIDSDGGIIYNESYLEMKNKLNNIDTLLYLFNRLWFVDITSKIMDLYMLRIFLNNDIDLCMTFTGIEHSMFLLQILVKYFDYNIDSISLLNDINKDQLINEIKNSNNKKFHKYLFPKKLVQCSNDTGFTVI